MTIELLQNFPLIHAILFGIVGLVIGSCVNVVVCRLPAMLNKAWEEDARYVLGVAAPQQSTCDMVRPSPHCLGCNARIQPRHRIPVLGWLALRGKCVNCGQRISPRYPLVELACGGITALIAWHFGYGLHTVFALILVWGGMVLFLIDVDEMFLPDSIAIPGIWLGLTASYLGVFSTLENAFTGAVAGYLVLALPAYCYAVATGRQGMGNGDFKLLALWGAWLGWQALPIILLLSSVSAAVFGLLAIRTRDKPFPFGPFIIVAGLATLLWGREMYALYSAVSGVTIGQAFFQ